MPSTRSVSASRLSSCLGLALSLAAVVACLDDDEPRGVNDAGELDAPRDAGSDASSGSALDAALDAASGASADADADDAGPHIDSAACDELSLGDLFTQRIQPLMAEDRPKSCNQCHLSGIDLSTFLRSTPCESMACLVEQGMVDLEHPQHSLILAWIARANPESPLITQAVIDEEYEGFLEWIEFSAACGEAVCAGVSCELRDDAPFCENADEPSYEQALARGAKERDCTDLSIERLFRDTIYESRGRCFPCHFDSSDMEFAGNPPPWIKTGGSCDQASLATLREVERRGYIDVRAPEQSLLLLKPLAEAGGGVEHGGAEKFHSDEDSAYVNFTRFIEHYAACKQPP